MDCFGTLSWEKTVENLNRSFTEKTVQHKKGGAGLGLYLSFSHANQFIINRKAGLRTEVLFIIEKNRRYKNYKERIKSFHFFEEA
jgi:sigma-B regulation protein RsbU (phosphoserine phosphatase)